MKVAEVIHENYVTKTSIKPLPTVQTIFNVLSIAKFNAHQWKEGKEVMSRVALLPLLSKVEHSCIPNTQYSSQNVAYKGYGAYIACRDIELGDAVSYGYIDVGKPRTERRTELLRSKDFFCQCVRCTRSEFCLLSCLKLNDAPLSREQSESSDTEELRMKMEGIKSDIALIDQESDVKVLPTHVIRLLRLVLRAREVCFPVHRIVITIYETLSTCFASIAVSTYNSGGSVEVIASLRMMSAQCGLHATSLLECEMEGCQGCADGHSSPAQHAMTNAFWAGMQIVAVYKIKHGICLGAGLNPVLYTLPPAADDACMSKTELNLPFSSMINILQRYMPLIVNQYGKEDEDVKAVADVACFVPTQKVGYLPLLLQRQFHGDIDRAVASANNVRMLTENQLQGSSSSSSSRGVTLQRIDDNDEVVSLLAMTELLALLDDEEAAAATTKNKNKAKKNKAKSKKSK